jgi:hypothetical protein
MTNILTTHINNLMQQYITDHNLTPNDQYDNDIEEDFNELLDNNELPQTQWEQATTEYINAQPNPQQTRTTIEQYSKMLGDTNPTHAQYMAAEAIYAPQAYTTLINK